MGYAFIILALLAIVVCALNFGSKHGPRKTQLVESIEREQREEQERIERENRERERQAAETAKLIKEAERTVAMIELMNQAKAVGDNDTVDIIMKNLYHGDLPTQYADGSYQSMYPELMIVKIAGINYRGNLSAYVGKFKGIMKPEPTNEYDQKAIMIKCEDGKHLGYVPEDETEDVRAFIKTADVDFKPYRIQGEINEGEDGEGKKYFYGRIYIVKKEEE